MPKIQTVDMDVISELASAVVERQWRKENQWRAEALGSSVEEVQGILEAHSYIDEAGDTRYIEEVQDEFNVVLDIIDEILNPET